MGGRIDDRVMAVQVALSLPGKHPLRIRQRVFSEKLDGYGLNRLKGEEGLGGLMTFLDKFFKEDSLGMKYDNVDVSKRDPKRGRNRW